MCVWPTGARLDSTMVGVKVTRCLLVVAVTSLALIAFGSNVGDGFAGVERIHSACRGDLSRQERPDRLHPLPAAGRSDLERVFVADADGSGARKVLAFERGCRGRPGSLVARRCVDRLRPLPACARVCSIWLVRPDGSGQRRVSPACPPHAVPPACADDSNPSFTPDDRHIVFQHEHGHLRSDPLGDAIDRSDIVETDLAGGHATVLVGLTGYRGDVMGRVSRPTGKQLVFERYNSSRHGRRAVWRCSSQTSAAEARGGSRPGRCGPSAPTGRQTDRAFSSSSLQAGSELAPGSNLFTIRPDGTGLQQVTHVPFGQLRDQRSTYSPTEPRSCSRRTSEPPPTTAAAPPQTSSSCASAPMRWRP